MAAVDGEIGAQRDLPQDEPPFGRSTSSLMWTSTIKQSKASKKQ